MTIRSACLVVLLFVASFGVAQDAKQGEVTFITANNVFVQFEGTANIAVGDTLLLIKGGMSTPCLLVTSKSSKSCACMIIGKCKVEKKDRVGPPTAKGAANTAPAKVIYVKKRALRRGHRGIGVRTRYHEKKNTNPVPDDSVEVQVDPKYMQRIKGRISAATYSTFSPTYGNDHRTMYRVVMQADHLDNSKFSADANMNYRKLYPADEEAHPQQTRFFDVYNLAVRYEPDTTTTLTLGRKINVNASSLGAIDGFQAEKRFGPFFAGGIIGSRPDIMTYGLNTELLQFGGYGGFAVNSTAVRSRATIGLMQQNNAGAVDRRYTYFQQATTINKTLNIFSSFELDLYNALNGQARLTNLFISSSYRFGKKVDLSLSFDSRRQVVYYETLRNNVELLLDDDQARQGARVRLTAKPFKLVNMGVSLSKRFQSSGQNASDNLNAFLTLSDKAQVLGRWSVQANRNMATYMQSDVISVRHTRPLFNKKVDASLYYRVATYTYAAREGAVNGGDRIEQDYYGMDLAWYLGSKITITALGEMSTTGDQRNYRMNLSITKRFDGKKQK